FTLIELLIAALILPLVIGGVTVAITTSMSDSSTISQKFSDSFDAQTTSAVFMRDVQNASSVTTASSTTAPMPCGTGTAYVIGLSSTNAGTASVVSYWERAGWSASDGQASNASTALTSASAHFVSTDVGRTISETDAKG